MSAPFTIQYGQWLPDLQNVATQIQNQWGPAQVPVADCLNVYYQDGAYRCLPNTNAIGAPLTSPSLSAYSWYDTVGAEEILFTAQAGTIYALVAGVWQPLPIETSITVSVNPWTLSTVLDGLTSVSPWKLSTGLGNIVAVGGNIFQATLTAGQSTSNNATFVGYSYASYGSLNPTVDTRGHTITTITGVTNTRTNVSSISLTIKAVLAQNYFTTLKFPSLGTNLTSSSASSFTTTGGVSTWNWIGQIGFIYGYSYPVQIIA